jgi:membrane carboxypeptidase/penicillin-binding protein PbpC
LAMVGSKDYFAQDIDGKYNVTTALRQPGSSIKPLNYATGIEMGVLTPATVFNDIPTCFAVAGQALYCPTNYDNSYHGPVALRYALGNSFNIPAVKALKLNTLESFVATASAMGIETFENPDNYGLSLTLGGGEVRMVDMAVAYGTLANTGVRQDLNPILKVEDRSGKVIEEYVYVPGERVISRETSYLIHHIMSDDDARSATFGHGSQLTIKGYKVAAKTGTTNDRRDNWTLGFTPSRVVVVWIGNNDNSPMAGIASGSVGASAIWHSAMIKALEGLESEEPVRPANIVGRQVCNLTGKLIPESGCETRYELFNKDHLPMMSEPLRQTVVINKDTGLPVQPGQKAENVEWQEHNIVKDDLQTILCLDCQGVSDDVKQQAAVIN